jgi:hypothetical protein
VPEHIQKAASFHTPIISCSHIFHFQKKKKKTTTPSNYIIHMVEPTFLMDPTPTSSQSPRVLFCYLSSSPAITYRKLSLLPPRYRHGYISTEMHVHTHMHTYPSLIMTSYQIQVLF